MKHTMTAAQGAGAQQGCVQSNVAGFQPILRRELLHALRKARASLGLSPGDVQVLDALLSFLPCRDPQSGKDRPLRPDMMLIVYASNSTICDRANGMSDRNLRRCIERLVQAGLVERRDSATGKRFPLRRDGRVVSAYGLDLTPRLRASSDIVKRARQAELDKENARNLRAEALALRAMLLRAPEALSAAQQAFVESAKTILRRVTLGVEGIRSILTELAALAAAREPVPRPEQANASGDDPSVDAIAETAPESAANGQTVRQVESQKIDTQNTDSKALVDLWLGSSTLTALFPKLPTRIDEFREAVFLLARYVGIRDDSLASALPRLGWHRALRLLDYIAENAPRINDPNSYLINAARNEAPRL